MSASVTHGGHKYFYAVTSLLFLWSLCLHIR